MDDNPANLKLLEEMLLQQGHEVHSFPLGRLALAAARQNPPDLILLDINMPEMNGYEVFERLKSTSDLSEIPVIFLSAMNETQDKVKAFQSGAVDYVSKPFQLEEVHSRVETHLQLYELQRALKLHNEHLEETVTARTCELAEANQRLTILDRSKSDFLNLISHEFRTPLHGLLGVSDVILEGLPSTEENDELREVFDQSRIRILSILDDALLLTQIDVNGKQFKSAPTILSAVLQLAMENTVEFTKSRGVKVTLPSADESLVGGDEGLLVRALRALFEAAIKFSEKGGTVRVTRAAGPSRIIIESDGATVPATVLPKFFDVFSIGEAITSGGDFGLGPALAQRILSLFGASVSVANREPSGIRLTVTLNHLRDLAI